MLLFMIRHGDPIYSPDTLTVKGKLQAVALADRMAVHGLDRIYSSPNGRARETAQPTADRLGLPVGIEDWTSENHAWRDFSRVFPDGRRSWAFSLNGADMLRDPAVLAGKPWYEAEFLEGTNAKAGYQRIADASDEFLARHGYVRDGLVYRVEKPNDERVAVVCHGGFGSVWIPHMLGLPLIHYWSAFGLTHTGVTAILFKNPPSGVTVPVCLTHNEAAHLLHSAVPFEYNNSIGF